MEEPQFFFAFRRSPYLHFVKAQTQALILLMEVLPVYRSKGKRLKIYVGIGGISLLADILLRVPLYEF